MLVRAAASRNDEHHLLPGYNWEVGRLQGSRRRSRPWRSANQCVQFISVQNAKRLGSGAVFAVLGRAHVRSDRALGEDRLRSKQLTLGLMALIEMHPGKPARFFASVIDQPSSLRSRSMGELRSIAMA